MTLFIAPLRHETQDEEIRALLEKHGRVTKCEIVRDRATRLSLGYAFAHMPDARQANDAIAALNGRRLGRRTLRVEEARGKYQDLTPAPAQRSLDEVMS